MCAFPFTALGLESSGISPDLNPEGRASMREVKGGGAVGEVAQ